MSQKSRRTPGSKHGSGWARHTCRLTWSVSSHVVLLLRLHLAPCSALTVLTSLLWATLLLCSPCWPLAKGNSALSAGSTGVSHHTWLSRLCHVCVWSCGVHMHVGQESTMNVFLGHHSALLLISYLRQGLSVNVELTIPLCWLASEL